MREDEVPNWVTTIRRAMREDAVAIGRIFEGPKVVWGTLQLPYPSVEMWRKRLEEALPSGIHSLVACVNGEAIGIVGLHTHQDQPRVRHVGMLGMAVRDDWQNRGVGSALVEAATDYADQWLGLKRIELQVFVDNEPAIRLYRRFGFEVEGRLRAAAFRQGRFEDVFVMGRVAVPGAQEPGERHQEKA